MGSILPVTFCSMEKSVLAGIRVLRFSFYQIEKLTSSPSLTRMGQDTKGTEQEDPHPNPRGKATVSQTEGVQVPG